MDLPKTTFTAGGKEFEAFTSFSKNDNSFEILIIENGSTKAAGTYTVTNTSFSGKNAGENYGVSKFFDFAVSDFKAIIG
jgi:hypothetical protein